MGVCDLARYAKVDGGHICIDLERECQRYCV